MKRQPIYKVLEKNFITCGVCKKSIKKKENIFLTMCCNIYYHEKCLIGHDYCPQCRKPFSVPVKVPKSMIMQSVYQISYN